MDACYWVQRISEVSGFKFFIHVEFNRFSLNYLVLSILIYIIHHLIK